jgi:MerR family transcriptional regulator, thiopeptide resistance regulator
MLLTLGKLARMTRLARASLLHYESLGLLMPKARSAAGYRLYGDDEVERLRAIRRYRDAGLSLDEIRDLLMPTQRRARSPSKPGAILEARLVELNRSIDDLRSQQHLLARLLASREFRNVEQCRDKAGWTNMLRRAGFSDEEMFAWHVSFEADNPNEHAAFLSSLGLARSEIDAIRKWSKEQSSSGPADAMPGRAIKKVSLKPRLKRR